MKTYHKIIVSKTAPQKEQLWLKEDGLYYFGGAGWTKVKSQGEIVIPNNPELENTITTLRTAVTEQGRLIEALNSLELPNIIENLEMLIPLIQNIVDEQLPEINETLTTKVNQEDLLIDLKPEDAFENYYDLFEEAVNKMRELGASNLAISNRLQLWELDPSSFFLLFVPSTLFQPLFLSTVQVGIVYHFPNGYFKLNNNQLVNIILQEILDAGDNIELRSAIINKIFYTKYADCWTEVYLKATPLQAYDSLSSNTKELKENVNLLFSEDDGPIASLNMGFTLLSNIVTNMHETLESKVSNTDFDSAMQNVQSLGEQIYGTDGEPGTFGEPVVGMVELIFDLQSQIVDKADINYVDEQLQFKVDVSDFEQVLGEVIELVFNLQLAIKELEMYTIRYIEGESNTSGIIEYELPDPPEGYTWNIISTMCLDPLNNLWVSTLLILDNDDSMVHATGYIRYPSGDLPMILTIPNCLFRVYYNAQPI